MVLNSKKLFFTNLVFSLLPETSFFGMKRALLRWAGAEIGPNVRICSSARFLGFGRLVIEQDTWIGHGSLVIAGSSILIGKRVDIGPRTYIGTGTHLKSQNPDKAAGDGVNMDVKIGDGTWIGLGTSVLPGVTIGINVTVGAGTLVNKDLKSGKTFAGVPARVLEKSTTQGQ